MAWRDRKPSDSELPDPDRSDRKVALDSLPKSGHVNDLELISACLRNPIAVGLLAAFLLVPVLLYLQTKQSLETLRSRVSQSNETIPVLVRRLETDLDKTLAEKGLIQAQRDSFASDLEALKVRERDLDQRNKLLLKRVNELESSAESLEEDIGGRFESELEGEKQRYETLQEQQRQSKETIKDLEKQLEDLKDLLKTLPNTLAKRGRFQALSGDGDDRDTCRLEENRPDLDGLSIVWLVKDQGDKELQVRWTVEDGPDCYVVVK